MDKIKLNTEKEDFKSEKTRKNLNAGKGRIA